MASLPWDIIVNILCRLRVKDLLRYRCVSKQWCSLIDGPDFIQMHLKNSMETSSNLGVVISDCDLYWVDLDSLDSAKKLNHPIGGCGNWVEVLGSCHGLLAIWNINEDIALWNPSTRRYRKLPISVIEFPAGLLSFAHPAGLLAFVQSIVYGFGYDSIRDDYKLVRVVQFYGDEDQDSFDSEVKIYSAKSNAWKRISDLPYYLRYRRLFGVLANNALHWVVSRKPLSDVSNFVFALDLVTEEYRELPLPDFMVADFLMVDVLRESLCLVCNCIPNDAELNTDFDWRCASDRVDMWVMKEYGVKESWTKLCTLVPSDAIGSFTFVLPIACMKSGNQVLMNTNNEQLILYDVESEKTKIVKISGAPRRMETKLFVESLVGLNDNDGPFGWKQGEEVRKTKKKDRKQSKKKQRDDFLSQRFKLVL